MEKRTLKYVAVVDKTQPRHRLINAVAHLALGMGHAGLDVGSAYSKFKDKTGGEVAILTDHPFIVLAAKNAGHLRQIHDEAGKSGVRSVAFLSNMFANTVEEQRLQIEGAGSDEHDYVGIVLFGDANVLRSLTKRMSLLD